MSAGGHMIQKVVRKAKLRGFSEIKENLAYWLSKTPAERVEAVEILRRQHFGEVGRIQKCVRVINIKTGERVKQFP
jgi:hypothetical protein